MKIKVCYLASLLLLLLACTENRPLGKEDNTNVYFGKLSDVKISDCIQITHFLPLETTAAWAISILTMKTTTVYLFFLPKMVSFFLGFPEEEMVRVNFCHLILFGWNIQTVHYMC